MNNQKCSQCQTAGLRLLRMFGTHLPYCHTCLYPGQENEYKWSFGGSEKKFIPYIMENDCLVSCSEIDGAIEKWRALPLTVDELYRLDGDVYRAVEKGD